MLCREHSGLTETHDSGIDGSLHKVYFSDEFGWLFIYTIFMPFYSKFQRNYEKIIKPSTADIMSTSIRSYLHIYKFLLQSMDKVSRN